MKIGPLIFHLPAEKKQKIRKIEKISKKIASVKSSLAFNRTCIKYIYIYMESNFLIIKSNVMKCRPTSSVSCIELSTYIEIYFHKKVYSSTKSKITK